MIFSAVERFNPFLARSFDFGGYACAQDYMETLEGRQSVYAALQARRRRMQMILVAHGSHLEKLEQLLALAAELGVPVKQVDRAELDAMAHGSSHGGVLAIATSLPRLNGDQLLDVLSRIDQPPLLLLL